ncbi:S8 family serine peptidase [Caballeronia sp. GAFFF3]|uniref:S8 family peptidase n=1 Tax=Caballeronia sp. GAFFF3 TaxID=2921759 RepID=UPI00202958CF|nr:S8 family serine peptidase [Caballeronia sp. GAFFF3]
MERCFIKLPETTTNAAVAPALEVDSARLRPYASHTHADILVASLAPEEQRAAEAKGARIYKDFLFNPCIASSHFFSSNLTSKYWEPADDPASPPDGPWSAKTLQDVLLQVGAQEAWSNTRGTGATIVVVDSGLNTANGQFEASRISPLSFAPSFSDGPLHDLLGHGSMVACIAAGNKLRGGRYDGIAPEATILVARTNYTATDLYAIYDRLISLKKSGELTGPIVVNNSFAVTQCAPDGRLPSDHPYAEIVREASRQGMILVFAAGNNHADLLCGNDPASCTPNTIWAVNSLDEVIAVGAVNWQGLNSNGAHANSSRGPGEWSEKNLKPDCVAPCYGDVLWGSSYKVMEWWGTSGAAPLVSGTIALMLSHANNKNRTLDLDAVRTVLLASCKPLAHAAPTCVGRGMLQSGAAIALL